MSPRRNPFETAAPPAAPAGLYEALRVAEPRRRSRQWEKQHGQHKAVYRGVDPKLTLQVKAIAGDLLVTEGEVARALIEHALQAYTRGAFDLYPRPNPQRLRMTLFPTREGRNPLSQHLQPVRGKRPAAHWRVITTWRNFPPELKREVSALAGEDGLHVPVGELVSALLGFGLQAYREGRLTLSPVPCSTAFTLSREGEK